MSEEQNTQDTNDDADALAAADLEALKNKATQLGVSFHPNIGAETLSARIQEKLAGENAPSQDQDAVPAESEETVEDENARRRRLKKEATEQIRVRIVCMNPHKKNIDGEIFTVSNSVVGTLKKYVPFEHPWHVPRMMVNMIQSRKCQTFVTKKSVNGVPMKQGRLINEFAVEIMKPLTEDELHDLAQRQAMAKGGGV
jgi:hypothetical protein